MSTKYVYRYELQRPANLSFRELIHGLLVRHQARDIGKRICLCGRMPVEGSCAASLRDQPRMCPRRPGSLGRQARSEAPIRIRVTASRCALCHDGLSTVTYTRTRVLSRSEATEIRATGGSHTKREFQFERGSGNKTEPRVTHLEEMEGPLTELSPSRIIGTNKIE